jgi:transcriptional regulator with XRE-family HTH domain
MSFRKNLEYLRKGRKLSQEDLGYKLGVSRQSVSKWESGAAYPETDKMLAMCKLFDCTLDELMNQNMQEEKAEEARRYTFNDLVKEATSIIDRSIRMITSMNFKSIVRFLFEIGVLVVIIMLVRIPFHHIYSLGADIFRNFSANISGVFLVLEIFGGFGVYDCCCCPFCIYI